MACGYAAGMVGGGEGADIGKSHRHAIRIDGHREAATCSLASARMEPIEYA